MDKNSFIQIANSIFKQKKYSSFSLAFIFSVALIIIYALSALSLYFQNARNEEITNIKINLVIKEKASNESISELARTLKANPMFSRVDSITPQTALESFNAKFGRLDSALLPSNPLPYVLTCYLKASNFSNENLIKNIEIIKGNSIVEEAIYPADKAKLIDSFNTRLVIFFNVFTLGFLILFAYLVTAKLSYLIQVFRFKEVIPAVKYWNGFGIILWLSIYYLLIALALPSIFIYSLYSADFALLPPAILYANSSILSPIVFVVVIMLYSSFRIAYEWSRLDNAKKDLKKDYLNIKGNYIP